MIGNEIDTQPHHQSLLVGPISPKIDHYNPTTILAEKMATEICNGYRLHDSRDRPEAETAFAFVDRYQFPHLSYEEVAESAYWFVESLWRKDEIERPHMTAGVLHDREGLAEADWEYVRKSLEKRATIVGIHPKYAELTTLSWKRHKIGGDYWTPTLEAQQLECLVALGVDHYPNKHRGGQSGYGLLPVLYLAGVELHDVRSKAAWQLAQELMTVYFNIILQSHEGIR